MYLYSFFSGSRYIYLYIYICEHWLQGPALVSARWLVRSVAALMPFGSLRTVGRRCRFFSCQGAAVIRKNLQITDLIIIQCGPKHISQTDQISRIIRPFGPNLGAHYKWWIRKMHIRDHRRSFSGWTDPCSLGHRPASFRLGDFRSVAALVPFGSLRTVGGRAGYSVVKVQL